MCLYIKAGDISNEIPLSHCQNCSTLYTKIIFCSQGWGQPMTLQPSESDVLWESLVPGRIVLIQSKMTSGRFESQYFSFSCSDLSWVQDYVFICPKAQKKSCSWASSLTLLAENSKMLSVFNSQCLSSKGIVPTGFLWFKTQNCSTHFQNFTIKYYFLLK